LTPSRWAWRFKIEKGKQTDNLEELDKVLLKLDISDGATGLNPTCSACQTSKSCVPHEELV
jgi:hypothetical protein